MQDKNRMLPQGMRQMLLRLLETPLVLCLLSLPATGQAASVEIQPARQITATADFRAGKADKPAVVVLHGFLQTREFGIVKSIADTLADEGYTVLSPNLSLGISNRKRSLDCEALHLHDMDGDIAEIQLWVQWLRGHGYKNIIGVGHSFGATQLLAWRERHREADFALIGVSLVGSAPFPQESKSTAARKAAIQKQPAASLVHAPLSFCETYTAPAAKFASYNQWGDKKVLAALKDYGSRTDVILGSEDKFPPPDWESRLAKTGTRVHRIRGANHFMDGTPEFDMLGTVLDILKR